LNRGVVLSTDDARQLQQLKRDVDQLKAEIQRTERKYNFVDSPEIWCEVISVAADWLVCRPLGLVDNTVSTFDFKVAKMLELQKTTTHGATIKTKDDDNETYTVSHDSDVTLQKRTLTKVSDSSTEVQVIVPRYVSRDTISSVVYPGSYLMARKPSCGTRTVDADGNQIPWIDVSPRAWAKST